MMEEDLKLELGDRVSYINNGPCDDTFDSNEEKETDIIECVVGDYFEKYTGGWNGIYYVLFDLKTNKRVAVIAASELKNCLVS